MDINTRISKAKTRLILEHPFIGTVAMNMVFRVSDECPTAMTNGKEVVLNPDFCATLSDDELLFLVAHECFHPMLEHCVRRGDKDPMKWNVATDYVINQLLADEQIGKMPDQGLLDKDIYDKGEGVSDKIYHILPEMDRDTPNGGNEGGQALDSCEDGGQSPAEIEQQRAEWKVKVAQASQSAKMMGKLSANMERLVGVLLKPKVDWRDVLQRFVVKLRNDDRSFARPNRRFISQGLIMPSVTGEGLGEIAFAIDTSGSIGEQELNQFASEVREVWESHKPEKIHVIYFDHDVCHVDEFDRDTEPTFKPHGGGGTAFSPVFKYMQEKHINPVACVFLTDLCCSDYGDMPDYPVLWVSTYEKADTPPFGEVTVMQDELNNKRGN